MINPHEKRPTESKKFIAFMVADMAWTVIIGIGVWNQEGIMLPESTLLLAMVFVKGFLQVAYIGSQAMLDKYIRVAEIATGRSKGGDATP